MDRLETLRIAEVALSKGAYRECLLSLTPLLKETPLSSNQGGEIGTMIVTALIGQGNNQQAISICEILSKHKKDSIRMQAKQLISVLNSPELARPKEWSIKIPKLDIDESFNQFRTSNYHLSKKDHQAPPTGSTKNLKPGFIIVTLIIFSLLTIFLSY